MTNNTETLKTIEEYQRITSLKPQVIEDYIKLLEARQVPEEGIKNAMASAIREHTELGITDPQKQNSYAKKLASSVTWVVESIQSNLIIPSRGIIFTNK
jgi:hypothetical protein